MNLVDVVDQVSSHIRLSGNRQLEALSEVTQSCVDTYQAGLWYEEDYCQVRISNISQALLLNRTIGGHLITAHEVINIVDDSATDFYR